MNKGELLTQVDKLQQSSRLNLNMPSFSEFLQKNINGDNLIDGLALNALLSKDRNGLLVYLLTTTKIIKIEIDKQGFQAFSNYLSQVIGINRGIISKPDGGNNSQITVELTQGSFGLRYSQDDKEIDSFFLKVEEQLRKIKVPS